MPHTNHAIVFGASGLAGWGVVDQLLQGYPSYGTFNRISALVNRPFELAHAGWTTNNPRGPKIQLVPHVNLMERSVEQFATDLNKRVEGLETVTHAFYFAYNQNDDAKVEVEMNCSMFDRALGALEQFCPDLEFVVFPGGTRAYGIYQSGGTWSPPLKESMGRLPPPAGDEIYYYKFEDMLKERSDGKKWTWCEVTPDAIIGFTPNGSTYNLTAHWALYLSVFAAVEGKGATVPFPGSEEGWHAMYNEGSSEIIAKISIWASLNPLKTSGESFNIADRAVPSTMAERWPALASFFGLVGIGPVHGGIVKPSEYIAKHQDILDKAGISANQVWGTGQLDGVGYHLSFHRQLSLEKARLAGFEEELDPSQSWLKSFERMQNAGLLPKLAS
ncbi:hypothetical protein BDP27DRAFT_1290701 [Rhodocollybia butyracea]|uniref:PRISE-like Rossmann-fold domain-containing protein n=1 Tax=Rhodocollybia butyracea TaxID=206335 RepID=A0A9P5PZQ3_9AGAR|nr:hypothetical protein BDP27DRAFT_1290701 [Rhodocollybia butyracea]